MRPQFHPTISALITVTAIVQGNDVDAAESQISASTVIDGRHGDRLGTVVVD